MTCNCTGPQNGEPFCPCEMRGITPVGYKNLYYAPKENDTRYVSMAVRPESDESDFIKLLKLFEDNPNLPYVPMCRMINAQILRKEICICAAVKLDNGRIIRGHRHADCIRNVAGRPDAEKLLPVRQDQQGFVTSFNRYVDRKEGCKLQREAGLRSYAGFEFREDDILTSEDLY